MSLPTRSVHGMAFSAIGYGCGGPWGMTWFPEETAEELIFTAIDLGINYFDTGPSYCGGNAEARLGRILKLLNSPDVLVSTKVGTHLDAKGGLYKDYSRDAIRRSLEGSLERLLLPKVGVLLIHGLLKTNDLTDELVTAINEIKEEGLATAVGASCDDDVARRVAEHADLDFLMTTFNLLDHRNEDAIARASHRGAGVLVKSSMAHGVSGFPRRPLLRRSNLWYNARLTAKKRTVITSYVRNRGRMDLSPPTMLRYAALRQGVTSVVTGTTSVSNLSANCRTMAETSE